MRVSLLMFGLAYADYGQAAIAAERAGFGGLWFPDHLVTPTQYSSIYPYRESGRPGYQPDTPFPDVWATMAYVAACTERIELGPGVFILPLRNAIATAKAAATVQLLSAGRLLFAVGSGWLAEEFAAAGEPFADRGRRMDDIVDAMRLLWTGEPVEYSSATVSFAPVQMAPPVRPAIPVVIGGSTAPALRRAAERGDGWFGPPNCPLERALQSMQRVDELRTASGRNGPFRHYVRADGPVDAALLERYERAGVRDLVAAIPDISPDAARTGAEIVAAICAAGLRLGRRLE